MTVIRTVLCELLSVRYPIMLAGMAGGPNTPELVGAVSRAGAFGVLGVTGTTVGAVEAATAEAQSHANGAPIGVNVQLAPTTPATGTFEQMVEVLAPFRAELGLPREPARPPVPDPPHDLVEAALAGGARAVTTWHDPTPILAMCRAAAVPVIAMTTTVEGGRLARDAGVDAIIAQGAESGGHRSTFGRDAAMAAETGTLALVPQMRDALDGKLPIIASGGIADGRGIAAAMLVGAVGVSLGTVFLPALESGVAPIHREALRGLQPEDTIVTDAVTGRPARWIRNRIVDALATADVGTLGWGDQGAHLADIRRAAAEQGRADLLPMLAGQAAGLAPAPCPADLIVADLVAGTHAALAMARGAAGPA